MLRRREVGILLALGLPQVDCGHCVELVMIIILALLLPFLSPMELQDFAKAGDTVLKNVTSGIAAQMVKNPLQTQPCGGGAEAESFSKTLQVSPWDIQLSSQLLVIVLVGGPPLDSGVHFSSMLCIRNQIYGNWMT